MKRFIMLGCQFDAYLQDWLFIGRECWCCEL